MEGRFSTERGAGAPISENVSAIKNNERAGSSSLGVRREGAGVGYALQGQRRLRRVNLPRPAEVRKMVPLPGGRVETAPAKLT